MEKYKSHIKSRQIIVIIMLLILPCILFFGCAEPENVDSSGEIHTVHFYIGADIRPKIDDVEVVDGYLCPEPRLSQSKYYDKLEGKDKYFIGWYITQDCQDGTMWNFKSDKVRSTMTLYGKWE